MGTPPTLPHTHTRHNANANAHTRSHTSIQTLVDPLTHPSHSHPQTHTRNLFWANTSALSLSLSLSCAHSRTLPCLPNEQPARKTIPDIHKRASTSTPACSCTPTTQHTHMARSKKCDTLLDLCVSSLRRGHANLLCIVPILTDDLRRGSNEMVPVNRKQQGCFAFASTRETNEGLQGWRMGQISRD